MHYRTIMLLSALCCIALGLLGLGCGASEPGVFDAPPGGGVAPDEIIKPVPVETVELEEDAAAEEPPPLPPSTAQPAPVGKRPKRLAAENPVPDGAKYRSIRATVYGADWCKACHAAEKLLRSKGVKVSVKNIETDMSARVAAQSKVQKVGHKRIRKIPVIDINGRVLVGYSRRAVEETLEKARQGRW